MNEVASTISMAAGKHISIAMTVKKLQSKVQFDEQYKYVGQVVADKVPMVFVGRLAKYNYHRDHLSVSTTGLVLQCTKALDLWCHINCRHNY